MFVGSAIRTLNIVQYTEFVCEQLSKFATFAAPFNRLCLFSLLLNYEDLDSAQSGRIVPRVADVIFMNHESRNALGVKP